MNRIISKYDLISNILVGTPEEDKDYLRFHMAHWSDETLAELTNLKVLRKGFFVS